MPGFSLHWFSSCWESFNWHYVSDSAASSGPFCFDPRWFAAEFRPDVISDLIYNEKKLFICFCVFLMFEPKAFNHFMFDLFLFRLYVFVLPLFCAPTPPKCFPTIKKIETAQLLNHHPSEVVFLFSPPMRRSLSCVMISGKQCVHDWSDSTSVLPVSIRWSRSTGLVSLVSYSHHFLTCQTKTNDLQLL